LATLGDPEKRLTIELSEPETNAIAFASSFVLTHFQAMLSLAGPGTFSKIYNHYAPTLKALSERLEEITEYHRRHDGRPRELPYYHEFGPCTLNPDLCNLCHQPKSSTGTKNDPNRTRSTDR
jgi:hypothetical protein